MTQATPTRIRSLYTKTPADVVRWEKWANEAPSDAAALVQLVYFQALQIRTIKLVLIWTLIILPVVFGIGFVMLTKAMPTDGSTF